MILFYGRGDDTPLRRCVEEAGDRGVDHRFVDQLEPRQQELAVSVGPHGVGGELVLSGERIPLAAVDGVYSRPLEPPADGRAFHELFVEWLDYADALVVNRPAAMHSNSSKPYQAQLIGQAGFAVPDTLVTDDPDAVTAFLARHGRVIFKSVSGIRSIVTELDERAVARLDRIRSLPTQFQEHVSGTDVRVHVVGDLVFPTEVTSDALDYRYARSVGSTATLRAIELPDPVTKSCVRLATTLGLSLCGIDLRRREDGEHVCFEVNPMPAFSYYEMETGQPISRAVVDLLAARM